LFKKVTVALITAIIFFSAGGAARSAAPKRIVSLTPVGTEILFDLGQGENIIAVTNFCDYPAEALKKPKIGGYAEFNFEALLAMNIDLLVIQDIHTQFVPELEKLKIPYMVIRQKNLSEIYDSIELLGKACSAEKQAAARIASIRKELAEIAAKTASRPRPRVMVCVSRELSEPQISSFYIAAANNFYSELIRLAGGTNVSENTRVAYPHISTEGLLRLNPEVIIDLVGDKDYYHAKEAVDKDVVFRKEFLTAQWRNCAAVDAVINDRIAILEGTLFLRPGPRVAQVVRAFSRAIHPEAWR